MPVDVDGSMATSRPTIGAWPATLDIQPLTPGAHPGPRHAVRAGRRSEVLLVRVFPDPRVRLLELAASRDIAACSSRRAEDTAAEGRAPGLVAYADGEVVGWVSVGPREDYERLVHSKVLAPIDDKPVWSIVCFVVGRRSRGQGVASALLDAAIDYARDHGATMLEAYPVEVAAGKRIGSGDAYKGTLSMYERAGFKVVERRQWNATTPVRPIVRRALRPRRRAARKAG